MLRLTNAIPYCIDNGKKEGKHVILSRIKTINAINYKNMKKRLAISCQRWYYLQVPYGSKHIAKITSIYGAKKST